MAALPKFQTKIPELSLMQDSWISRLNPILANPGNSVSILPSVVLTPGTNVINHKLGQPLQGWYIVRQRQAATIYDTQDTNQSPSLTLTLVSNVPAVIDLVVF